MAINGSLTRRHARVAGALLALLVAACGEDPSSGGDPSDVGADRRSSRDIGSGDAAAGDAGDTGTCDCAPEEHCDADGVCQADLCEQGTSSCASQTSRRVCSATGDAVEIVDCTGDWVCDAGFCAPPGGCPPEQAFGCEDGMVQVCNAEGTGWNTVPCPAGQGCVEAECRPVLPNVLLLVDTSSSMNWTPGGQARDECSGQCWPWSYPACDNDALGPRTRLGRVKDALTEILGSEAAANVNIALQRFPQSIYTALPPDCEGGYWTGNSTIQGDEGYHTLSRTWLAQRLSEVVLEPFPTEGETDPAGLARWFDTTESLVTTGINCASNAECDDAPCLSGTCMAFENPELWGMGLTPFGRSLFYAGEYMRHFVVVEGRSCQSSTDCGSANYSCVDGQCHDPFRHCRPNVVIAFTDGEETEHFYTDDFFHPRVQAKRLHYGLGCEADGDCGGGATCQDFVCRPPPGVIDDAQLVCDADDTPCASNGDCTAFRCLPARLDFVDPAGEDRITDSAGDVISLTIHVVDASNVPDANNLVAAYGGGQHFSVDLDDPDEILATFETLFGDAKELVSCLGDQSDRS